LDLLPNLKDREILVIESEKLATWNRRKDMVLFLFTAYVFKSPPSQLNAFDKDPPCIQTAPFNNNSPQNAVVSNPDIMMHMTKFL
jgi:hypothetical protein